MASSLGYTIDWRVEDSTLLLWSPGKTSGETPAYYGSEKVIVDGTDWTGKYGIALYDHNSFEAPLKSLLTGFNATMKEDYSKNQIIINSK